MALALGSDSGIPGVLVGAPIVTTIENGLNIVSAAPYIYPVVKGIIFFAVMVNSVKNSGELR